MLHSTYSRFRGAKSCHVMGMSSIVAGARRVSFRPLRRRRGWMLLSVIIQENDCHVNRPHPKHWSHFFLFAIRSWGRFFCIEMSVKISLPTDKPHPAPPAGARGIGVLPCSQCLIIRTYLLGHHHAPLLQKFFKPGIIHFEDIFWDTVDLQILH